MKKALLVAVAAATLVGCSKQEATEAITSVTEQANRSVNGVKWANKNLNVSTYRNGDPIPHVTDPTEWANLTTGAWCWYNNDSANYWRYGKLYNWYAVNDPRGLAPRGWHIPTNSEWDELAVYLDPTADTTVIGLMGTTVGTAMKSRTGWPNGGSGTNSSGFNGLPGGWRFVDGTSAAATFFGCWWTASARGTTYSWFRMLNRNWTAIFKSDMDNTAGMSVRVVKD